ncbi:MAG: hypothetical protein HOL85_02000 [Rhodospirillaceae bacterium]|jgi:hypothetical protein|nr:hypothetical protein [Rhodospirillaceae bacterium]MBT6139070.1 hypothetical protein [Rhodospirillaceae bacterium]
MSMKSIPSIAPSKLAKMLSEAMAALLHPYKPEQRYMRGSQAPEHEAEHD